MSIKSHKDYTLEKERLEYTKEYLDVTLKAIEEYKSNSFNAMKEDLGSDDATENSMAYINMMLKSQTMDFAEKNYYGYKKALSKPYFARIDFTPNGENITQKVYIGKTSLMKAENNEMLIVDWRAPISSIYYDGSLGHVTYESEDGILEGDLSLKRQFTIENGELKNILDIDITANDEFLQDSLSASAESRLKDIASTIQAEQNKVIRAPLNRPIIIQGVAGSGKTTIALHRIAYFMYTYEKTFNPENFLIIAPNNLFINYISEVLPELGVENVKQNTYVDFMKILLGIKPKVINKDDSLSEIIEGKNKNINEKIWTDKFKGSWEFVNIINSYIKDIEKEVVPKEDFVVRGKTLLENHVIVKMFFEDLHMYPFKRRIKEIEKSLKNKLSLVDKDLVKKVEFSYDLAINKARKATGDKEEVRKKVVELINERDHQIKLAEDEIKNAVKNYLEKFNIKNLFDYYLDFLSEETLLKHSGSYLTKDQVKVLSENSLKDINSKKIYLEDLAPLVYLKHRIYGFDKKISVKSVVIDEAQDFSVFEFYALKESLNTCMFTLLGDTSQGIYSYRSFNSWEEVIEKVFKQDKPSYMTLVQSYRTTIEVMNLGNEVIKSLNDDKTVIAKPVIRHGEKPDYIEFENKNNLIEGLEDKIISRINENYKSIAIICKTLKECKEVKKLLDKSGKIEAMILNDKNKEYEAGVIILPSYLAKGLEFDNVFIVNISESYSEDDLDTKLLYVAITRTLHRLHIYTLNGKVPILNKLYKNNKEIFN